MSQEPRAVLPEDKGFGKIFWIVLGAIVSALVALALTYLVKVLSPTPTPTFDAVVLPLGPDDDIIVVDVTNVSSSAPAKDVTIGIDVYGGKGIYQSVEGIDRLSPVPDRLCRLSSSASRVAYFDVYFDCPLINPRSTKSFSLKNVPRSTRPVSIGIYVVYEGDSSYMTFWRQKKGNGVEYYKGGTGPNGTPFDLDIPSPSERFHNWHPRTRSN